MEQEDEEGRAVFASELTEAMKRGGGRFIIEPSFVPCEDLIMGRLSYHGMNPEIERILASERGTVVVKESTGAEITDVEMAEHYSTLVGTIDKKFKTKKSRKEEGSGPPGKKRTKFIKPADD